VQVFDLVAEHAIAFSVGHSLTETQTSYISSDGQHRDL